MLYAILLLAQEAANQAPKEGPPAWFSWAWIPMLLVLAWLILIRPAQSQEKQRQAMIANLQKNDEVLVAMGGAGGLYATVVSVHDTKDEVVVRIDDNTRVRVTKGSIIQNLTQVQRAKEAAAQAKATTK
jgi:preprotein translocase YajC subunit